MQRERVLAVKNDSRSLFIQVLPIYDLCTLTVMNFEKFLKRRVLAVSATSDNKSDN